MIYIHTKGNVFPQELVLKSKADLSKPYSEVEIPNDLDPTVIHYKYFTFEKNESFILNEAIYREEIKQQNTVSFRIFRENQFKAFDILKMNSLIGIDTQITAEELSWYSAMKDFPTLIKEQTKETDYPITPARVARYL